MPHPTIIIHPDTEATKELTQHLLTHMISRVSNSRARNLISHAILTYQDIEFYLNKPSELAKWRGMGRQSITVVKQFLQDFYDTYQKIENGQQLEVFLDITAHEYPFLTADECRFVVDFHQHEGRYPVFFIASKFLLRSSSKHMQLYAHANGICGEQESMTKLGQEFGLTRERVRQISSSNIAHSDEDLPVWDLQRWQALDFISEPLLTTDIVKWDAIREAEHLNGVTFFGFLSILRLVAPLNIISLQSNGTRANGHRSNDATWRQPDLVFAAHTRFANFRIEAMMEAIGHDANLKNIEDIHLSLPIIISTYTRKVTQDDVATADEIASIIRILLPMLKNVEVSDDMIIIHANSINYLKDIYDILHQNGKPMSVEDIWAKFRSMHPDDHHTNSSFIRSYMLRDNRFQAVGSKSVYQLREWNTFAGSLNELAVHLLRDATEPVRVDLLCRQMMAERSHTTYKSCYTSIYLAAVEDELSYYIDSTAILAESEDVSPERRCYYVGLTGVIYPQRFWPSPHLVQGAIRGIRRFLAEYERWPFSKAQKSVEAMLYYTHHKYTTSTKTQDPNYQLYHQALSDIQPMDFPANDREMIFLQHCRQMAAFCKRYHRLPTNKERPQLATWWRNACTQEVTMTGFRQYHFEGLKRTIQATRRETPNVSPTMTKEPLPRSATQLTMDFNAEPQ